MGILLSSLILNLLGILDITTTEYAINKKLADEKNPLVKNNKIRRITYIPKVILPFVLGFLGKYSKKTFPLIWLSNSVILMVLIGLQSFVDINNLWVIFSKKRELKKK